MKRVQGSDGMAHIECANPRLQKWIVRWDIQPCYREDKETGEQEQQGLDYYEHWFTHKPSPEEIKEVVTAGYNALTDEKILSGFVWKDMPVWLSTENQFNYKAAYDLAIQTQGASLPVTFKFGDTVNPVYYTFTDVTDFTDFYVQAMTYINTTLAEGWQVKDSIDWNVYELKEESTDTAE